MRQCEGSLSKDIDRPYTPRARSALTQISLPKDADRALDDTRAGTRWDAGPFQVTDWFLDPRDQRIRSAFRRSLFPSSWR